LDSTNCVDTLAAQMAKKGEKLAHADPRNKWIVNYTKCVNTSVVEMEKRGNLVHADPRDKIIVNQLKVSTSVVD
jgi:hypothetical protein